MKFQDPGTLSKPFISWEGHIPKGEFDAGPWILSTLDLFGLRLGMRFFPKFFYLGNLTKTWFFVPYREKI